MLISILSSPWFLIIWCVTSVISVSILFYDLTQNNAGLHSMMKWVWGFTVLYSSVLGLIQAFLVWQFTSIRDVVKSSKTAYGVKAFALLPIAIPGVVSVKLLVF